MSNAFIRITHGRFFEICDAFLVKSAAADAAVAALATELKAQPEHCMSAGQWLTGFYFSTPPAKGSGWLAEGKKYPRYYRPNVRTVAGKALLARMNAIKLMTGEELANDLGLPHFFRDLTGQWCTSVGVFRLSGVIYLEFPSQFLHHFAKEDGVEQIPEWQHVKARSEL